MYDKLTSKDENNRFNELCTPALSFSHLLTIRCGCRAGACFSKVPQTFQARKASRGLRLVRSGRASYLTMFPEISARSVIAPGTQVSDTYRQALRERKLGPRSCVPNSYHPLGSMLYERISIFTSKYTGYFFNLVSESLTGGHWNKIRVIFFNGHVFNNPIGQYYLPVFIYGL